ncbi:hypothetical protein DPMN_080796 [Dreissena polymorpha]|uniref:Uncharacterized protein n=1 Tax=Dreissena polymorpha TaxID=45954 RepID=A0A9D3YX33_DREPO|nr:hypothetical protein DPMN_080796 [Dreissena polymorpha]
MWARVSDLYNVKASKTRSADKLEKKWLNLVAKHRIIYTAYVRDRALTGGGCLQKNLNIVTEAIMNVIGIESPSIAGAAGVALDSSFRGGTARVYCDGTLRRNGFQYERHWNWSEVLDVKSHLLNASDIDRFDRTILLIRDPLDAMLSYFTWATTSGHHTCITDKWPECLNRPGSYAIGNLNS